jgi:mono/diheme cytochrome c family protein
MAIRIGRNVMLWKTIVAGACAAVPCLAAAEGAQLAFPQDVGAGQAEYMIACAACHGETGKGDGPIAGLLNIETPDLTMLASANGGAFPYDMTLQTIDGRNALRAHGSAMPVWGTRYFLTVVKSEGYDPAQAELLAKGRMLSLVEYLRSIQE